MILREERFFYIDMTTTVTFCPVPLCQAQCSVLHMYSSFDPSHSLTGGGGYRSHVHGRDQKRPHVRKSSPFSGFLEARGGGEANAEVMGSDPEYFFYPFPDSFIYYTKPVVVVAVFCYETSQLISETLAVD